MITAQDLYNWRADTGAISGEEMHLLFQELVGNPSPAGSTPLNIRRLEEIEEENAGGQMSEWARAAFRGLQP